MFPTPPKPASADERASLQGLCVACQFVDERVQSFLGLVVDVALAHDGSVLVGVDGELDVHDIREQPSRQEDRRCS